MVWISVLGLWEKSALWVPGIAGGKGRDRRQNVHVQLFLNNFTGFQVVWERTQQFLLFPNGACATVENLAPPEWNTMVSGKTSSMVEDFRTDYLDMGPK